MADRRADGGPSGKPTGKTVIDRRSVLGGGALIGGAVAAAAGAQALPPGDTQTFAATDPWKAGAADNPAEAGGATGYRFFGPDEAAFIEAACARLIPGTKDDPGAIEANVPIFIDRQLGGRFGRGDHYYLLGPWPEGSKTQGYQSRFSPAELYRHGIKATDAWCKDRYAGKLFRELTADQQDEALKALESGDAKLGEGVSAKTFFTMLLGNVQEGFWADPIYGGNKDMVGWKMIGFPGAHYDYSEWVERHNEPWPLPPVGLKGRPAWQED